MIVSLSHWFVVYGNVGWSLFISAGVISHLGWSLESCCGRRRHRLWLRCTSARCGAQKGCVMIAVGGGIPVACCPLWLLCWGFDKCVTIGHWMIGVICGV